MKYYIILYYIIYKFIKTSKNSELYRVKLYVKMEIEICMFMDVQK